MNLRLSRFWSILRKNRTYNLTYESQGPADSKYNLNRRNPNVDTGSGVNPIPETDLEWLVLRVFYPLPNSIEVLVGGQVVKP